MRRRRAGHILNISSLFALGALQGYGVYSASEFAVEGLSEALHAELAPLGVQVTSVQLGLFRTDFLDSSSLSVAAGQLDDYHVGPAGDARRLAPQFNRAQPGDPAKAAAAIVTVVESGKAPLMPLGKDTLQRIEGGIGALQQDLSDWRELAGTTDHQDPPAS